MHDSGAFRGTIIRTSLRVEKHELSTPGAGQDRQDLFDSQADLIDRDEWSVPGLCVGEAGDRGIGTHGLAGD